MPSCSDLGATKTASTKTKSNSIITFGLWQLLVVLPLIVEDKEDIEVVEETLLLNYSAV